MLSIRLSAITVFWLLLPMLLKAQTANEEVELDTLPITVTIDPHIGVAAAARAPLVPQRVAGPNTVHAQPLTTRRSRRSRRVAISDDVPSGRKGIPTIGGMVGYLPVAVTRGTISRVIYPFCHHYADTRSRTLM